ncbi:hypothetical protein MWN34_16640 [Ancylobacter sp. 6x-1]|uniref:Uncharacterized protein n=1 Tax=Ancylobacter crimeensis TaxID=2579147 RepID=A0ABT0DF87_9HYPH|nr:hypothetical protein [Ancylobacter crimeensis]MCK0198534.1 hypothetical protein [Ancylobacter crimeensis]
MPGPFFVTAADVITLNQIFVETTGEPFHIRDRGLLESALAVPINCVAYNETTHLDQLALHLALDLRPFSPPF